MTGIQAWITKSTGVFNCREKNTKDKHISTYTQKSGTLKGMCFESSNILLNLAIGK